MERDELNMKLAEFTAEAMEDTVRSVLETLVRLHDITGIPTDILSDKFCERLKDNTKDFLEFCKKQEEKRKKDEDLDIE